MIPLTRRSFLTAAGTVAAGAMLGRTVPVALMSIVRTTDAPIPAAFFSGG